MVRSPGLRGGEKSSEGKGKEEGKGKREISAEKLCLMQTSTFTSNRKTQFC